MTIHGSYGNKTDNIRRSYVMHLMPGTTRRIGDNWNPRLGDIDTVAMGAIVQGEQYPELAAPARAYLDRQRHAICRRYGRRR